MTMADEIKRLKLIFVFFKSTPRPSKLLHEDQESDLSYQNSWTQLLHLTEETSYTF